MERRVDSPGVLEGLAAEHAELVAECKWLARNQQLIEQRLAPIENSLLFRMLRGAARLGAAPWNPLRGLLLRLLQSLNVSVYGLDDPLREYQEWSSRLQEKQRPLDEPGEAGYRPNLLMVLDGRQAAEKPLWDTVTSAARQSYPNWRLAVPGIDLQTLRQRLQGEAVPDAELRVTEAAGAAASGADYVLFLSAGDVLSRGALWSFVEHLQAARPDVLYGDEEWIDDAGMPAAPEFKPDWSPDLLDTCMYLGHAFAVSHTCLEKLKEKGFDWLALEPHELALRATALGGAVAHVPSIVNHRRASGAPDRLDPAMVEAVLLERGVKASVRRPDSGERLVIRRRMGREARVSILICSRNPALLSTCLEKLSTTTEYRPVEFVVVHHRSGQPAVDEQMRQLMAKYHCVEVPYVGPFHYSKMNNLGAEAASGEFLVFLNDDVWPLVPDWLDYLAAQVERPEVGAAGARLLYPNGTIQHAGVVIGINDNAGHPGRGLAGSPYWKWLHYTRNVTAVTGACLAMRKELFLRLGGFDLRFPVNYNDVDLCLRAGESGYLVVYEANATLRHAECQSRAGVTMFEERRMFFKRWHHLLQDRVDPFYNPHLTGEREDASLNRR